MYNMLIVYDEAGIHKSLKNEGLKKVINRFKLGLEIKDTASNGTVALELLRQNHYDILITGINMKDMTGYELVKQISDEKIPVKLIIFNGCDKFDYVPNVMYRWLSKHITRGELLPNNVRLNKNTDKQLGLYSKVFTGLRALDNELSLRQDDNMEEQYVDTIKTIFEDIKSDTAFSSKELYSFITELFFKVFGTLQINEIKVIPGDDLISMIIDMRTVDEIQAWFIATIRKYIAAKRNDYPTTHSIAQKLVKHVELYYSEEMSLKSLSYKFGHNPSYMGQIFKDETGMLFNDYLCSIRVEHAKKLLAETNMKARDISSMVGFRNTNYFSNVFKSKTGHYPTMYRKLKLNEA